MVAFPLRLADNKRYLVDAAGNPFRIQGDSSWDFTHNCSLADVRAYLDDRQNKGFNACLIYYSALAYFVGGNAPWVAKLGGSGAGTAALPFTKNTSGGAWDGDPNFTNHDASYDTNSRNDSFFEWLGQVIDECATRGIVCFFFINYQGTKHATIGDDDGWAQTTLNATNTQAVCNSFGQYLANGNGTFQGFKNRPNIIWVIGGDATPANASELAKRELQMLQGMQAAGDVHLVTGHIAEDSLITNQTDWNPYVNFVHTYCKPPTYGMSRGNYNLSPVRSTFLLETDYWGVVASRAVNRYTYWAAAISTVGGMITGFGPFWGFIVSADGTSSGSPTIDVITTAWHTSKSYQLNNYVSHVSNWYRCITAGTSAASGGPSGTAADIVDNTVHWTFVTAQSGNMNGVASLLSEPAILDIQQMGKVLDSIPWHRMIPSGLGGMRNLIPSGGGTQGTWSDGNAITGGTDWIVASQSDDGLTLIAYVPDAHSGSFTVDIGGMQGGEPVAQWIDPVSGLRTNLGVRARSPLPTFTVPGANAGGDNDWILLLRINAGLLRAGRAKFL